VYDDARAQFNEKELADLTLAIAAINAWNRLSIAARLTPGTYQPAPAEPGAVGAPGVTGLASGDARWSETDRFEPTRNYVMRRGMQQRRRCRETSPEP